MLRSCCLFFVALCTLFVHTPAYEQQQFLPSSSIPSFHHLTYSDGLLGHGITAISQDASGFLWFGFVNGLQRYDGEKFVNYPYRSVYDLQVLEDEKSKLLITRGSGLETLNLLTSTCTPLPKQAIRYSKVYSDENGNPWRLFDRYLQPAKPGFNHRKGVAYLQNPEGDIIVFQLLIDETNQQTWAYDGIDDLLLLDEKSSRLYSMSSYRNAVALFATATASTDSYRGAEMDKAGNLWVFTWADVFCRYDIENNVLHTYHLSEILKDQGAKDFTGGFVNYLFCDRQGNMWIATSKAGLLRYDAVTERFPAMKADLKNAYGLHYDFSVTHLFQDREDNIWVGTDKGVSYFNPYRQPFTVLRHEPNAASMPADEITDAIETNDGHILAATWGGGVAVYNREKRYLKTLRFEGLHDNQVWSFAQRGDTIAAGCQYGVIHLLQNDRLVKTLRPSALEKSTIRCTRNDANGNTWLGLNNGKIVCWKRGSEEFIVFNTTGNVRMPRDAAIMSLFFDKGGTLWLAAFNGLKQFDPATQQFSGPYQPKGPPFPDDVSTVCCAVEEWNDSILLVGFQYHGLTFFNRNTKQFTPISIGDDTRPQSVFSLKKDEAGIVWLTTEHDIFQWNTAAQKFTRCTPNKGVADGTFFVNRFQSLRNGASLTWTSSELLFFQPRHLSSLLQQPPTITGFKLFDKAFPVDSVLAQSKPVVLSHHQNFFTIEFASLQFSHTQQINYLYRLSGIDADWVAAGNKRYASYTKVPPGEYLFEVKTEGSTSVVSFSIILQPAFWHTSWFQVLICSLAGLLIFAFVRWRINMVKQQATLRQRVVETEMAALRAQMNPHFIFNCINSIDALIQSNDKYNATVYLNKFARLIRNILDSSKQNSVPLTKDLETLQLYIDLERFRSEEKFTAEVHADEQLLQGDYRVPPLIVQPYVENAIQHGLRHRTGTNGKLTVNVSKEKGSLLYSIEDNGVGRMANRITATDRSHYGMQMSSDRIMLFNEEENASVEITDLKENGEAKGTRVRVWLKVK